MEILRAKSFSDFECHVRAIRKEHEEIQRKTDRQSINLLFRGQENASWSLKTTLNRKVQERNDDGEISVSDYYQKAMDILPQIESITEKSWNPPESDVYKQELRNHSIHPLLYGETGYKAYSYLCYLRHHGFPSPLLDWSQSPYIAAFFATRKADKCAENVSVHVFLEYGSDIKITCPQKPHISGLGSNVRTHRRHFLQQSEYTVSTVSKEGTWYYTNHEDAISEQPESKAGEQDKLWKIELPVSVRDEFLNNLHTMNINAYSLFQTEDTLMETLARAAFSK